MNRAVRRCWGWVVLLLAGSLGTADAAEGDHTWSHPAREYPRSLRRWFEPLPAALQYSEVRYMAGDDPRFAGREWDDSAWAVKGIWDLPARTGVDWVRFRVRMGPDGEAPLPSGLMISTARAYEVYWDGVLLGTSGTPGGSRETEVAGRLDQIFSIPGHLHGPGEHVVALRTSSYRVGFPAPQSGFRFLLDDPARLQGTVLREAFVPTLAAGALCMIALAALIMWLVAARRATLMWLGGLGLAAAAMQALQAFRWFYPYPADWHYPLLTTMVSLVGVQVVLTVGYVVAQFDLPHRRLLLGGLLPVLGLIAWIGPERMNLEGVWMLAIGLFAALACAAWAVRRRRRGAWPVALGVTVSLLLLTVEAEDFRASFFLKFLPALLGLIVSLALRLHDERRQARAAELASARMELEVLKKNIQPHFLLNTLATIVETIEQEPKTAVALVTALAGEFRILSRVAGEKLIPLAQELELCREHLAVMSLRKGARCTLAARGVDERALVPPALFHTLIENGLTHLLPRAGEQKFELQAERIVNGVRYTLLAHGAPAMTHAGDPARRDGTGLRYIKARLEESFAGRWLCEGAPWPGGWRTVLEWQEPREAGRA